MLIWRFIGFHWKFCIWTIFDVVSLPHISAFLGLQRKLAIMTKNKIDEHMIHSALEHAKYQIYNWITR